MRIAIPTTTFFPEETVNGITNTVMLISRWLVKKGHDVTVFAPLEKVPDALRRHSSQPRSTEMLPEKEVIDGINIVRIKTKFEYKYTSELTNLIKNNTPDVVHSFHYGYYPATAGFNAANDMKIPHIFTTSYHNIRMSFLSSLFMRWYDRTQGKKLLSKSVYVFPQNMNEAHGLENVAKFNCKIMPCPVNSNVFKPKKKNKKRKLIAYIGTMLPWKGAGIAFNICKQIEKERDDVDFVFIGPGALKPELMRNSSDRFTFDEWVPLKKLAEWYNKADVMLYPTQYESFGRVLAESMMCGTPIVSTKVGAVPETVGKGGLLVDYGDWSTMKSDVLEILDDKKLHKELRNSAIKHASNYKDFVVAKNILETYEEAVL